MARKQNVFKQYPLIPSVFFILFAWALLYLITNVKGENPQNTQTVSPIVDFISDEEGWAIKMDSNKIIFKASASVEAQEFTQIETQFHKDEEGHSVQVIQAQSEEDQIRVSLTRFKSNVYQLLVNHNGQFYYHYGK